MSSENMAPITIIKMYRHDTLVEYKGDRYLVMKIGISRYILFKEGMRQGTESFRSLRMALKHLSQQ